MFALPHRYQIETLRINTSRSNEIGLSERLAQAKGFDASELFRGNYYDPYPQDNSARVTERNIIFLFDFDPTARYWSVATILIDFSRHVVGRVELDHKVQLWRAGTGPREFTPATGMTKEDANLCAERLYEQHSSEVPFFDIGNDERPDSMRL